MTDEATAPRRLRAQDVGLHNWIQIPKSEPMRCSKCGTYYASRKGAEPCPAMRESA